MLAYERLWLIDFRSVLLRIRNYLRGCISRVCLVEPYPEESVDQIGVAGAGADGVVQRRVALRHRKQVENEEKLELEGPTRG